MARKAKTVKVVPTEEHPLPYDLSEDKPATFQDELSIAATTAELLDALGSPIEVDNRTLDEEKRLLDAVIKDKDTKPLTNLPTALGVSSFLRNYGQNLALDTNQVRAALTHKLIEIADCGDTKYELRAIELLGKHSDIGLFTERSEININYNSPEALETAIKERVKRLLNADVVDIKPLGMDLEEELGFNDVSDAEFEEVEEEGDGPVS